MSGIVMRMIVGRKERKSQRDGQGYRHERIALIPSLSQGVDLLTFRSSCQREASPPVPRASPLSLGLADAIRDKGGDRPHRAAHDEEGKGKCGRLRIDASL